MEIDFWYLVALVLALIYTIPILILRIGVNRRQGERRGKERRVRFEHVPIERRQNHLDRRVIIRRA